MNRSIALIGLTSTLLLLSACSSPNTDTMRKSPVSEAKTSSESMTSKQASTQKNMAQDFTLTDLDGNAVTLSELEGKGVYIKFWASWCSICLAGLGDLDDLAKEDHDYEIYTIVSPNFNGEQSEADFKEWFASLSYNHIRVLLDTDGTVAKAYGIRAYPTSAFIDPSGHLSQISPGHMDNMSIDTTMMALLKEM